MARLGVNTSMVECERELCAPFRTRPIVGFRQRSANP